ncbi:MAG TPA: amylo-alpha-1,6-glucosidase [Candidatus Acidoferrales bacterium]|nr:amylo-alpha-1,6-glucosidase [Candidatus Acidoferrales bacterium]
MRFGREVCGSLEAAEQREWLVTNGIGGFASGTVSGNATRRYHGLLFAAVKPPLGRTQLVAELHETAQYAERTFALSTSRWASGTVEPNGYLHLECFHLDGTTPVWRFAIADALIEKRVWMRQGENTTYIQYTLERATRPLAVELKALVNYRDFHACTHAGDWRMTIEPVVNGVRVVAFEGAVPFYLFAEPASCELRHEWYRDFFLPQERYRGLDDREDHLLAAVFRAQLKAGQMITVVASTNAQASLDAVATRVEREKHDAIVLTNWNDANRDASVAPDWVRQLVLAADQFVVARPLPGEPDGRSIIAGYHWFGDWGRDTMISLPGLTLATGRPEIAKRILLTFANYVDRGMLPNNFPDGGEKAQYNTVDAALWFFEAVRQYVLATKDKATLERLFPVLTAIIDAHLNGTRYNIHADASDGLLYAGEPGVQLTWMDAKVGDWVVTPRIGKPVEVNALWYNALESMAALAPMVGKPAAFFAKIAARVRLSFQKFWNESGGFCFDVIDAPEIGADASLRPNQIFAVSLPKTPLTTEQQKSVVDICALRLVTSYGLRSLARDETGYQGRYAGGPAQRDGAYHQGTVWGWLLGPFVLAHYRVYGDREAALSYLEPLGRQIQCHGLGTLSEIADGDEPFAPRGCIAQAWAVGETLRAWRELQPAGSPAK